MSDKKSKKSADLEANLAKIANAKPRRRSRKDNIYERFITRVENVDSTDNSNHEQDNSNEGKQAVLKLLKNANKLSSYEPLSAAELELFASQQDELQQETSLQGTNASSTGVHLDFSDENDEYADTANNTTARDSASFSPIDSLDKAPLNSTKQSYDNIEDLDQEKINIDDLSAQSPTKLISAKNAKLASSKKPLIIGMIVGSLLIAAVVLTLIFAGFLSTTPPATDTVVSNNSDKVNTANETPVANNGQENKNPNKASADTSNQSTVDSKSTAPSTNNKNSSNEDKTTAENESKSEPAITYEDFREESQSTLFRETND
ncbi:hypothetical protein [Psychrobacter immobilis]|uniref:hypothetical protein n=1 Tax=Psychrobacter immobilis TaxID=498 RepID=UPI0019199E32|nr:hypothetical protein [Psychrobacter immobilis]